MPVYEYLCWCGEKIEKMYLTFSEAETFQDGVTCPKCGQVAARQMELPFPAHLHGSPEGYYKPSPAAKRVVNPDSISFEGGKGNYVK